MTPRTFFTLLIKIMGICLLASSLSVVSQLLSSILIFFAPNEEIAMLPALIAIAVVLLISFMFYITLRYCFFRTDWIIDKLSLDKHFEEEKFDLNIHRSTVLAISVVVIGAMLFIESFPSFCKYVYLYVGQTQSYKRFGEAPASAWIIFEGIKTCIGYLLMTYSRLAVNFIERQRKR